MIGVSFLVTRTSPRYRSAVVVPLVLVRTACAVESICHGTPRWCAAKSAPIVPVSELPLVPTNDAPICASQRGGGSFAGAGAVCASALPDAPSTANVIKTHAGILIVAILIGALRPDQYALHGMPAPARRPPRPSAAAPERPQTRRDRAASPRRAPRPSGA